MNFPPPEPPPRRRRRRRPRSYPNWDAGIGYLLAFFALVAVMLLFVYNSSP